MIQKYHNTSLIAQYWDKLENAAIVIDQYFFIKQSSHLITQTFSQELKQSGLEIMINEIINNKYDNFKLFQELIQNIMGKDIQVNKLNQNHVKIHECFVKAVMSQIVIQKVNDKIQQFLACIKKNGLRAVIIYENKYQNIIQKLKQQKPNMYSFDACEPIQHNKQQLHLQILHKISNRFNLFKQNIFFMCSNLKQGNLQYFNENKINILYEYFNILTGKQINNTSKQFNFQFVIHIKEKLSVIKKYKQKFPLPILIPNFKQQFQQNVSSSEQFSHILNEIFISNAHKIFSLIQFRTIYQNNSLFQDILQNKQINQSQQILYLLYKTIYDLKQINQQKRWRQIQDIFIRTFLTSPTSEILLNKIMQFLNNQKQQKQYYECLGNKIIAKQNIDGRCAIQKKFSKRSDLQNYLTMYEIIRSVCLVPVVINVHLQSLQITQNCVQNVPHKLDIQQGKQFINIALKISQIQRTPTIPQYNLQTFNAEVMTGVEGWNIMCGQKNTLDLNNQTELSKILQIIYSQLHDIQKKVIYRDINLTNILRSTDNSIYMVDYQNLAYGIYIIDIVYLLNDKYFYYNQAKRRILLKYFINNIRLSSCYKTQQITKHFDLCSYYLTIRWAFRLFNVYLTTCRSFHMNLKVLMIQLYRSTRKAVKYFDINTAKQMIIITNKMIKAFVRGYSLFHKNENLKPIFKKIIIIQNTSFLKKNSTLAELKIMQKQKLMMLNVQQLAKNIRQQIASYNKQQKVYSTNQQQYKHNSNFEQHKSKQLSTFYVDQQQQDITLFDLLYQIMNSQKQIIIIQNCNMHNYLQICQIFGQKVTEIKLKLCSQIKNKQLTENTQELYHNQNIQQNQHYGQQNMKVFSTQINISFKFENVQQISNYINMVMQSVNTYSVIILAAGHGSRFGYRHKALIQVDKKSLFEHWVQKMLRLNVSQIIVAELEHRVSAIKAIIDKKFQNSKDLFQFVTFQQPIGSAQTIICCLKQCKNAKTILISCDTYTNIFPSDLYFQSQFSSGKFLMTPYSSGKFINDRETRTIKSIKSDKNQMHNQNLMTFSGIGCFMTKKFIDCLPENAGSFEQMLKIFVQKHRTEYAQMGSYFIININRIEDYEQAVKISQKQKIINTCNSA